MSYDVLFDNWKKEAEICWLEVTCGVSMNGLNLRMVVDECLGTSSGCGIVFLCSIGEGICYILKQCYAGISSTWRMLSKDRSGRKSTYESNYMEGAFLQLSTS